jgi:ATP-dependent exoDNAse (exonuclease V) alpha subunit
VILTGLDGLQPDTAASLLYVGITRARSHLVIVERAEVLARWGLAGRSAERTQNVRGVG